MKVYAVSFFILLFISALGCKRPMKEPELIDPIYADLIKEQKAETDRFKKLMAEAETIKADLNSADPRTGNARAIRARYYSKVKEAEAAQQMAIYYELRARTRKMEARQKYLEAFNKNLPWPDPSEYEAFQAEMRLKKANKNWDAKTKKWSTHLANALKSSESQKPSEEKPKH